MGLERRGEIKRTEFFDSAAEVPVGSKGAGKHTRLPLDYASHIFTFQI